MRVALAQVCSSRDVSANLGLVRDRVAEAASRGARLVVFPEATMRAFGHNLDSIAEPLDGPFATAITDLAAAHGITVVVGMFTPGSPREGRPRVRNTLLAAGPGGVVGYDKIHLFDAFGFAESDTVEAGDQEIRISVDGVTVGLTTCYDVRFPQLFINHARAGAELIVVATSWGAGDGKQAQWEVLTQARALDSTSWILACAQADPSASGVEAKPGAPTGIGCSRVVSPTGRVVAAAGGAEPDLVIADINPDAVERARRSIPVLANARLS
jgi:predicted amidohydrolase